MKIEEYLKENYGKIPASKIAELFDMKKYQVYELANKLGIKTNKVRNKQFAITETMYQILLGGYFGDGNFRKMGNGAIYREKHALDESQYCLWKYKELGDLTSGNKLYYYKDKYINFDTANTKQIREVLEIDIDSKITQLGELGLLLFFFDDGWTYKRDKGRLKGVIGSTKLSLETMQKIGVKYKELCQCNVNVTTRENVRYADPINTIYIHNIGALVEIAKKYNMEDLDIYKKKFIK